MWNLVKLEPLHQGKGHRIYATSDAGLAIMEFDQPEACELAFALQSTLRRHALSTSYEERLGSHSLVVKRLRMLPLTVVVKSDGEDAAITYGDPSGEQLERDEVEHTPEIGKHRLDGVEDTALHSLRTLRAYLGRVEGLSLTLAYGVSAGGELILQVINPPDCDFGTDDYAAITEQLGGTAK